MGDNPVIRPLCRDDRRAIRDICRDTADRGRPLSAQAVDSELLADLLTRYYTDVESRWSWVAEAAGCAVGYVLAAPDTWTFRRTLTWRIVPWAALRAVVRGVPFTPAFRHLVQGAVRRCGRGVWPVFSVPAGHPAHLHINLLPAYRGRGTGSALVRRCLAQLSDAGVAGVHATVRADHPDGCGFFERMDFKVLAFYDAMVPCEGGVQDVRVKVYGRRLAALR